MNLDLSINSISENDRSLFLSIFEVQEYDISSFSCSSPDKIYSGNYIKVTDFKYWNDEEKEQLKLKIDNYNSKAESVMVLDSLSDYEIADDRYYEASFSFTFTTIKS